MSFAISVTLAVIVINVFMGYILKRFVKSFREKPGAVYRFIAFILLFAGTLCFIVTIVQHRLPKPKAKVEKVEKVNKLPVADVIARLLALRSVVISIKG